MSTKPRKGRKKGTGLTIYKPNDNSWNEQAAHFGDLVNAPASGLIQQLLIEGSNLKFPLKKGAPHWPEFAIVFGGELIERILRRDVKYFEQVVAILSNPQLQNNGHWFPEDPVRKWIAYRWQELQSCGLKSASVSEMLDYLASTHGLTPSENNVRDAMKDLSIPANTKPGPKKRSS